MPLKASYMTIGIIIVLKSSDETTKGRFDSFKPTLNSIVLIWDKKSKIYLFFMYNTKGLLKKLGEFGMTLLRRKWQTKK